MDPDHIPNYLHHENKNTRTKMRRNHQDDEQKLSQMASTEEKKS